MAKTTSLAKAMGKLILVNSYTQMEEVKRASAIESLKLLQPMKVAEEWFLVPWPVVEAVAVKLSCSNEVKQEELKVRIPRIASD